MRELLLFAVLGLGAVPALAHEGAGLGWIYVESNVGGSSGGHVALRLGDTIYHVQQAPGGLWELNRDDWKTFRHLYAGLQNRPLTLAEIDVSAADLERAQARLARAYVAQRAELERRERLALDLAWLEAWREGRTPPPLAGAGLLAPETAPDPDAASLLARVRELRGARFLPDEIARVSASIEAFDPGRDELVVLREALLLREALQALEQAWGLADGATLPLRGRLAEPLSETERRAALRFAEAQREAVLALLASQRPDRARPLLLALARHQALARSAAGGRLVLLDAYAGVDAGPDREAVQPATWARLAAELETVVREGRPKVLADGAFDEPRYNLLELGAGLWRELDGGAPGHPVRKLPRQATPDAARVVAPSPPGLDPEALAAAHARAERALAAQQERLHALYRYGVLRRNCVTELARLLNEAFPPDDVARALGAELEPGAGLTFIPFAFFDEAKARLRVAGVEQVASYRERELERLLREEPGLTTRLAESSALTSSIYTPRFHDGSFLLFTDGVFWRRPLFGLANLGYAAGSGVFGLLAAPFDGAARLRAAGSGVWYSLPELAFFNIRKGTFEYVPPEQE